jgi:hypothetical protein
MIVSDNEREFCGKEESVFLMYELSDFPLLLYKASIMVEYEHPVVTFA